MIKRFRFGICSLSGSGNFLLPFSPNRRDLEACPELSCSVTGRLRQRAGRFGLNVVETNMQKHRKASPGGRPKSGRMCGKPVVLDWPGKILARILLSEATPTPKFATSSGCPEESQTRGHAGPMSQPRTRYTGTGPPGQPEPLAVRNSMSRSIATDPSR